MNKKKDLFSEIVKDKLDNYILPVDDDSWNKIAEQLSPLPQKKNQRWWIAPLAVAASIALLFLLFTINKKTYHHETASQLSDYEKTIIQNVSEKEIVQQVLHQDVKHSPVSKKSQSRERLAENSLTTEVISKEETVEENPVILPEEGLPVPEKQPVSSSYRFNFGEEEQILKIKRIKRQSIRFSFGSGGNLLAQNSTDMSKNPTRSPSTSEHLSSETSYFRAVSQEVKESLTEDILSQEDYPDVIHQLPISFGVTLKKELNQTFSIESGLVYSFVETKFSRDDYPKSKADLQLHYVGIPLNVHINLYKNRLSPWEVYLSAGGTIEKGILSHFVQKTFYDNVDNYLKTVTSNEKIKGLQWSVGISPGVDYKIHKNYSVYFEPKLSYYFDNNQPVSARTEHPVVVSINAGVRCIW